MIKKYAEEIRSDSMSTPAVLEEAETVIQNLCGGRLDEGPRQEDAK
jgi:hypothetical protein